MLSLMNPRWSHGLAIRLWSRLFQAGTASNGATSFNWHLARVPTRQPCSILQTPTRLAEELNEFAAAVPNEDGWLQCSLHANQGGKNHF